MSPAHVGCGSHRQHAGSVWMEALQERHDRRDFGRRLTSTAYRGWTLHRRSAHMPGLRTASTSLVRKTATKDPRHRADAPTTPAAQHRRLYSAGVCGAGGRVAGLVCRIRRMAVQDAADSRRDRVSPDSLRPFAGKSNGSSRSDYWSAGPPRPQCGSRRRHSSRVVTDARSAQRAPPPHARRWGYRGPPRGDSLYSNLLPMRPAEWPIIGGAQPWGYVLAVGWRAQVRGDHIGSALLALGHWVGF